jgi:predicted regulator of Ras-like GTPase activity (Roadblock/LC7/MglB family)
MTPGSRPGLRRRVRSLDLPRDTDATAFTVLLSELIARIPGARAAALVDADGESIDYAGTLSPFDVKIAAAHWQIVLAEVSKVPLLTRARQVIVRGVRKSFLLHALADGYAVVVVLSPRAGFATSARGFSVFERALVREAGIGKARKGPEWTPVVVEYDARSRPRTLAVEADASPHALEVLGAVMGLARGERGFRVRLATGVEATVVREPGGVWYADEPIEGTS